MHEIVGVVEDDLTKLQREIMGVINIWVHEKKTPVPLKVLVVKMKAKGVKGPTIINSINGLLKKGYIRRSCVTSNRTYFVMIRSI